MRHGLSSFNRERKIQGRNDLSLLTTEGEEQASLTGRALSDIPISAVYSSPLRRAAHTTKKITESSGQLIQPIFDEGLLEIDLEPWSGLTIEEVIEKFPEEYHTWKTEPHELIFKRADGSSYKPIDELIVQAKKFLNGLIKNHPLDNNENLLVVGHNAILRALILSLIDEPRLGFRRIQIDNASLSTLNIISFDDGKFTAQIECLNNTTHLKKGLPRKGPNTRLILVRHGETDWNREGRFQGQIDIPLNKNGQAQALAAKDFLKSTKIDRAYSSSMSRPKKTAEIILDCHPDIPLSIEEELVEISHGLWEGKLESEIKTNWPKLLEDWKNIPESVQMPEGESIKDVWGRSICCWEKISSDSDPNETVLVVAHDAVNKTILCHLLGLSPSDIWMVKQGNGAVTIIDISIDSDLPAIVTCLNLTSHLGSVLDKTATGAL